MTLKPGKCDEILQVEEMENETTDTALKTPAEFDGTDENGEQNPSQHDKQIDIEVENHGQRRKLIIALTWPALAEDFLTSLMNMFDMLKIIAVANPISNARFVYVSALRGAGDARFMAIITFVDALLVRPLVSILLINFLNMGLSGAWIALLSDGVICFIISMIRYRKGKWP